MEPLAFVPVLQKRVWGGTLLRDEYHRALPDEDLYGESWEVSDRPEGKSIMRNGPWKGWPLDRLLEPDTAEAWLGKAFANATRFPLLIKLLDARQTLSLQVHPPMPAAAALHGEPKTEMWYFLKCSRDASIYAGLQHQVSATEFRQAIEDQKLKPLLHEIKVSPRDAIFIPSGRLHAIKAGSVLLEIQENSNTTYRVYDWGRTGMDGKPRELHVEEALDSIDFHDVQPQLSPEARDEDGRRLLAKCDAFTTWEYLLDKPLDATIKDERFEILACVEGRLELRWTGGQETLAGGDIRLIPAGLGDYSLLPEDGFAVALRVFPG
jgi:mannose-6-phosphate isomerase